MFKIHQNELLTPFSTKKLSLFVGLFLSFASETSGYGGGERPFHFLGQKCFMCCCVFRQQTEKYSK